MKIAYQGIAGSYSESCAKEKYADCETIPCKTFDECFEKANQDSSIKAIIPESNKTTGNIGVEYLIFKYRLNICVICVICGRKNTSLIIVTKKTLHLIDDHRYLR